MSQVTDTSETAKADSSTQEKITFVCPTDGEISQDDVVFLCNICSHDQIKEVDGLFICKQCESDANPLECRICGSKDVKMHSPHLDLPQE